MRRLVHLTGYTGPYGGSFVPMLLAAAREARRREFAVEVGVRADMRDRPWIEDLRAEGIEVHPLPLERVPAAKAVREIAARRPGPLVLHSHFTTYDIPAALAGLQNREVLVFWHLHSALSVRRPVVIANRVKFALGSRLVQGILAVAPSIADDAKQRGARRVEFVPNAIDTAAFAVPSPQERSAARAALGVADDASVLLHFGWDWHRKGGDLFVDAVRKLADDGRRVLGLTVGWGEEVERAVVDAGASDIVRLVPSTPNPRPLLAAADVFVSCSRAEGMPFSMTEALATGVPVVASDLPGHVLQAPGMGARRIVALDATDVARGISSLLDRDPAVREADADAARAWVVSNMDLRAWSSRMSDLYDRALVRGNPVVERETHGDR